MRNMSAKTKKGTTPTHAHDSWPSHDGAAGEGAIGRRVASATRILPALAPPPDHRRRDGRQDVIAESLYPDETIQPDQGNYFTFAPTTVSHCVVMTCFA
jgi:hypothetical protein